MDSDDFKNHLIAKNLALQQQIEILRSEKDVHKAFLEWHELCFRVVYKARLFTLGERIGASENGPLQDKYYEHERIYLTGLIDDLLDSNLVRQKILKDSLNSGRYNEPTSAST